MIIKLINLYIKWGIDSYIKINKIKKVNKYDQQFKFKQHLVLGKRTIQKF